MCVKIQLNSDTVMLQSCPGLHFMIFRCKKTSLFGTDHCKNHTIIFLMCFSMKMRNFVEYCSISQYTLYCSVTLYNHYGLPRCFEASIVALA